MRPSTCRICPEFGTDERSSPRRGGCWTTAFALTRRTGPAGLNAGGRTGESPTLSTPSEPTAGCGWISGRRWKWRCCGTTCVSIRRWCSRKSRLVARTTADGLRGTARRSSFRCAPVRRPDRRHQPRTPALPYQGPTSAPARRRVAVDADLRRQRATRRPAQRAPAGVACQRGKYHRSLVLSSLSGQKATSQSPFSRRAGNAAHPADHRGPRLDDPADRGRDDRRRCP